MAFIPYFVVGPTSILSLIGFLYGPDETVPNPAEDWRQAKVDLLIPAYNEEKSIVLCLSSIAKQTLKPRQIILIDDASADRTTEFARIYADELNLKLKIIKHEHNQGKTPSVYQMVCESDADAIALVDGDTVLKSENYLERLVQELFQGAGIASAFGMVFSLTEKERQLEYVRANLQEFSKRNPEIHFSPDNTWFELMQRGLSNSYRNELYLFLQKYIYSGEMVFFGTTIFPIGCAVVYRRECLKKIFDKYTPVFGFDLTTSEDIFFGFAFAAEGYKNVAVHDVMTLTTEPRFPKIYKQIFKWSSSYLQSCFYFNHLSLTPFRWYRNIKKNIKQKFDPSYKEILEKRKIKESYRQPFGERITTEYGRNIGWFIFTTLLEKTLYSTFLIALILLRRWEILAITVCFEVMFYSLIISVLYKKQRIRNFLKAVLFNPIRYSVVLFDFFVTANFMLDLWITKNRKWRK